MSAPTQTPIAALRELAAAILAYGVGVVAVALIVPTVLAPLPLERIAIAHPKVVARTPLIVEHSP
jgi:hypothetical protein